MATIKSEMPPLHAAETLVGSVGTGGGSSSGGGGGGNNNNNSGNPTGTSAATTNNTSTTTAANNTISAAADSSDNQPSTPQPQIIGGNNEQQQNSSHHPYATHHMYSSTAAAAAAAAAANAAITTTAVGVTMPHMYGVGANSNTIYATAGQDMQQQQQQLQQQQQQHAGYSSYLNSYEQFYQQQAQQTQSSGMHTANGNSNLDYGNTGIMYGGAGGTAVGNLSTNTEYSSKPSGVRYHPYLQTPTSGLTSSAANNANTVSNNEGAHDTAQATSGGTLASSGAVSTTTSMSPRVVSSTSPTSTSSNHLQLGNSSSPSGKLQCKKCGIMSTNESELQEHITNVHGASPYGSSGYSSSPYIKEEMQTASTPHQQSSQPTQQQQTGGNPGDILDLDSQKMVYPPLPGGMPHMMHHPLGHQQMHDVSDPLHSMHTMQQRALPTWDQPAHSQLQEGLSPFMQQQHQQQQSQQEKTPLSNQSPYYSPKQSPYHISGGSGVGIKHEYPIIKSEYADSQNYVDKSFDPTSGGELCQQPTQQQSQNQQQMMPVSSSPAEFPSTTTGPQDQTQQYRGFEPPTSSSALPANSVTTKAASWKSNEARRPKTYNCTACNKWFTSSGHLKRHYNTTLHKNAVKSSGQPDPATMPISVHHHPSRDPGGKLSRRNNSNAAAAAAAAAQQQQQPPAPVQPPEPPRSPQDYVAQAAGLGQMSHYSASPSPTHHNQQQQNGMSYGQQSNGYQQQQFMQQVQSTTNASPQHASNISGVSPNTQTVLNGHPNGLAGPSAQTTPIPSSNTRGLLNTTTTTTVIAKIEPTEDNQTIIQSPMGMEMEMLQQQQQLDEETVEQLQLHQSQLEEQQMLEEDRQHLHYQQVESLEQHRHYHNSSHSSTDNMQAQSPLIISHQQYQEQLQQQQHQQMVDNIYSRITPPQPLQQAHMPLHNITDHQYNIMPLDINMPQHSSSMQLQQQPQHITTNTATTNTDSIHTMLHNHLHQRLVEQQELPHMHNTLLNNTSIQSPLDTSTIMHTPLPLPITTQQLLQQQQLTTHTIPSFQQLQQVSGLEQPGHTMTYHTIIGNQDGNSSIGSASTNSSELLQFTTLDGYGSMQSQQMVTSDGQILQFIPTQMTGQPLYTLPQRGSVAETYSPQSSFSEQRSPQEADLPPTYTFMQTTLPTQESSQTTTTDLPSMPYSPTISSSLDEYANNYSDTGIPMIKQEKSDFKTILSDSDSSPTTTKKTKTLKVTKAQKRKRTPSAGSISPSTSTSTTLPTGRIKCIECDKEFTKICYLTQHNKCFHSDIKI
ncbi:chromatin modification-related protein eaf-1 isoform X2 [Teleopsis dalmanni]|uniref:chromatin modification-related protein eaf-1 isoform X2 n=1 Tax=Teleopsis dalmanni TaxID=139649 RepID=UPI0018CF4ACB|nr:chromatin modification-related protein eaf-1 isoform X2 [Teleopsis dalmanni]